MARGNGAGTVTNTSKVDGVHLDENQHLALGRALAAKVREVFSGELT